MVFYYTARVNRSTLGPAYNDFKYSEHLATTSNFFSSEEIHVIDITEKVGYNEYRLKLLVVCGTQCTRQKKCYITT